MGQMRYDAMVVGERDLADGLPALKARAEKAHLPLLSANLADASGAHPFEATRLVDTPNGKVGLFAVTLIAGDAAGLHAEDGAAAAHQAIESLRRAGAQVVIALVHGPAYEAPKFLKELPVDLALYGHDGRIGTVATEPPAYGGGQKGRSLARIAVELGKGPLRDGSSTSDAENEVRLLDDLYKTLQQRKAAATTDQARQTMEAQLKLNRERRAQAQARAEAKVGRSARLSYQNLDESVPAEPKLQAQVDAEVASDGHSPVR